MAEASVEIPAELVARIRASVVLLYQAAVEGLLFALRAHAERDGPIEDLRRQRERLARLDALLVQVGWWAEPGLDAGGAAVELIAPPEILHDALYGALIDAGERLALACGESWRADGGLECVRAAAVEVIAIDRLLGQVRRSASDG
jgi:hypothetical protein